MRLPRWFKKGSRRVVRVIIVIALTLFAIRIYDSLKGAPLEPWHKIAPTEVTARQINKMTWQDYLLAEQRVFDEVKNKVTDKITPNSAYALNRYSTKSPIYPEHFAHNWNRSFILKPTAKPVGAVVLLHGLTDSPYSLRHIAYHYQQRNFLVVAIRMPAHGTVPAALAEVHWEDWLAATHLAVRTARSYIEQQQPLHIVGYSNGGALAMIYSLQAIDNPKLAKPEQVILISPMIGVTSFARYAGLAGLPSIFPPFAKAAWLDLIPEYNPFKYNSFPVNGARQSYELTTSLQKRLLTTSAVKLAQLPPILTFQSVVDSTVNAPSVVNLYNLLPSGNHELVLFDVNKTVKLGPLLRSNAYNAVTDLLPQPPRLYQTSVVANASPQSNAAIVAITKAKQIEPQLEDLQLSYPTDIYSLSHIALPFPETDSLYGRYPVQPAEFGISLGALAIRGERAVLVTSLDNLLRVSANPFYPYLIEKIDKKIDESLQKNQQSY